MMDWAILSMLIEVDCSTPFLLFYRYFSVMGLMGHHILYGIVITMV
jgi:hypothetical protein